MKSCLVKYSTVCRFECSGNSLHFRYFLRCAPSLSGRILSSVAIGYDKYRVSCRMSRNPQQNDDEMFARLQLSPVWEVVNARRRASTCYSLISTQHIAWHSHNNLTPTDGSNPNTILHRLALHSQGVKRRAVPPDDWASNARSGLPGERYT
jgi:hypothetical protein